MYKWKLKYLTCNLTLAVSRGKVIMSAIHPALPAAMTFAPRVGVMSDGVNPTIVVVR